MGKVISLIFTIPFIIVVISRTLVISVSNATDEVDHRQSHLVELTDFA